MVLGLLTAIAACPAIVGTTEAIRQGQRNNAKERHRGRKSNLVVSCSDPSPRSREINGGSIVLRDKKLWVTTVSPACASPSVDEHSPTEHPGHLFAGYFLPYPDHDWGRKGEGLVSTITDDPPQLNWIYVDEETYEVKYGNRLESEDHIVGPWDCTMIDRRITFDGWEGFVVVEENEGTWALYFDLDDNGLDDKVSGNKQIMEIELTRKEMKKRRGDD